ncbi:FAD-binding oxidoreductase [Halomonas sp. McH1-25]|uniref:NAD(P)/FAD-dependent oxidoreductase n=1 Tax=unclassified Halomonas TaxID=2609666 RepID=UPI001EF3FA51|nr:MULTISPECIES: FAD-binding oxidoreductase [unclassified Halomonas]MCG7599025.1 FAD-binding oxidoreductase [Halomonas sp. McH1-25]MCP1343740.1 FAD-binding oxidoreductase [Halomonas sp. FL8]MCP1360328.1 FAD-binding oxidoreductase [Halomonas sp. BBD45]MCP1364270.1 FAD-binding oxidoreductase [Halomonas sp. BBD48]
MTAAAQLRRPSSYYNASVAVRLAPTPPLAGKIQADVCVVGGGVTGCSAALHLAERGYRVVLLEAGEVGFGASGRSGGQILPGLGTGLDVVEKALGRERARDIWEMSRESVRLTAELIQRHAIPCDLAWGYLHAAVKSRHVKELRAFQGMMARDYDYPSLSFLEGEALRDHVATDAYPAALYDAEGGHLHPLNYTLGLALAAQRAGAAIHEQSAALHIERGRPARVDTAHGSVSAEFVVLATNAYVSGLVPELEGRIMRAANYIVATAPLSEAQAAQVLPRNDALSDANFVLDYYRLSGDRRLLYGGEVSYNGREPRTLKARMDAKIAHLFPALRGVAIDYRWGGDVAITLNRAPDFGRLDSNLFYAQGYSGHGMSLAGLAGKLLSDAIAGQAERFDVFASMPHRLFPGGRWLRTPLLVLATNFYKLRDRL